MILIVLKFGGAAYVDFAVQPGRKVACNRKVVGEKQKCVARSMKGYQKKKYDCEFISIFPAYGSYSMLSLPK